MVLGDEGANVVFRISVGVEASFMMFQNIERIYHVFIVIDKIPGF